jgi:D-beta-D-heptose 7-phosphate kinase/D-beta-D-heptose 1-phosphate adenosyltransferase
VTYKKKRVIAVSGGFDPIHIGHVELLKQARALGDELLVILNNDHWLRAKKQFAFMPQKERKRILLEFPFVDRVEFTRHRQGDPDRTVCRELRRLRPHVFANGGDRKRGTIPEYTLCEELGIELAFKVGGNHKAQSSSWLTDNARVEQVTTHKPWGHFQDWSRGDGWHLKTITVAPGGVLSLQSHACRDEVWVVAEGEVEVTLGAAGHVRRRFPGDVIHVPRYSVHRLASDTGATVVEVTFGEHDEADIVRHEDRYGRTS